MGTTRAGIKEIARRVFAVSAIATVLAVIGLPGAASATWSVVAVDAESGRVGAVMASCVDPGILGESDQALIPIVLAPGAGVGVVQGTLNWDAPDVIRQRLADGVPAAEILDFLTSDAFETNPDQNNSIRQYGIVALEPESDGAVFTGQQIEQERQAVASSSVAAQGLLLADVAVVDNALDAYEAAIAEEQTMDQALVEALVAGAKAGGDRRCGDQTALFAQLVVAEPDDDPLQPSTLLTVTVDEGDGQNPVFAMADAFEQGQRGWIDAGQRSSIGVSKLWAAVVAGLIGAFGVFLVRKGMGNTAARR